MKQQKQKMNKIKTYENFPFWMVAISNILPLLIYIIGAYILYRSWVGFFVLYIIYCFWFETRVLRKSCRNCYYYGKICCFGKGKLCSLLFKKGNSKDFCKKEISWIDILPDFLVSIIPFIAGVILLIKNFNWIILLLMVIIIILSFGGSAFIRGNFACRYCKQREIGCPAEKLFNKKVEKRK
jgi:hypothetical protein